MTTLREAAQQALDALEDIFGANKVDVGAINALRAALEETAWCEIHQHHKWCEHNGGKLGPTGWEKP